MAKKAKKKSKQEANEESQKHEVDAVKVFIVVLAVLIAALVVFNVITNNTLDAYNKQLADAATFTKHYGKISLKIRSYLRIIDQSEETVLMNYPNRFFESIYRPSGVGISDGQITVNPKQESQNHRENYTEISWDLDIRNVNRKQSLGFLWGVENKSPKAKAISISLRRDESKSAGPDSWRANFKVGYRVLSGK